MMPLGMRGQKKVQDLFVDDKVPRWERHRIPVVTDARGRIVWIVGRRISEGARLTERTAHIVRLSVRKAAAGPILPDRNRDVEGKRVSVRVEHSGQSINKKKK